MLIIRDITNPMKPIIAIPIAEIFVTCWNSSLEGFFKTCQTRLHFSKNELNLDIINLDKKGI